MAVSTVQKVQEYKDSLKTKAEQLIIKGFPEKIVKLNELLETPSFCNRELSDVHQDLNVPIPDPILLNHSDDGPAPKKRKSENNLDGIETSGTKVMALPNGPVPCNKPLCELIHLVKPYIRQLVEDSNLLKMWISFMIPKIEDGNNFGVSIQEDTLAEIQSVESEAAAFFDQISRYFISRGKIVSKVAKYPHIIDYRRAVQELDEKEYLSLWLVMCEAIACLSGFPAKVRAINDIITTYSPETAMDNKSRHLSNSCSTDPSGQTVRSRRSKFEHRERISKRRYHRKRSFPKKVHRRRPGPLANILTALSHSLALCTNTMVITPSRYIGNQVLATLRDALNKRKQLMHLTCNLSTILPTFGRKAASVANSEVDSTVGNCIGIMRPAAAQLIADTTKLKRWLQALAVAQNQTPELIQAIRRTESIDGWAYELFFHLKYLQENELLSSVEKPSMQFGTNDGPKPLNLWHRLVQLRDNYAYLYESLYNNNMRRFLGLTRSRTSGVT